VISTLIGPWGKIRQMILHQTMKTNQSPRHWSPPFLQLLFKELHFSTKMVMSSELLTVEQYLLSSEPLLSSLSSSLDQLRWNLYRQVLTLLDDWWRDHAVYPTDILYHHRTSSPPFPSPHPSPSPAPSSTAPAPPPRHFKDKDHVRISLTSKLFRLYLSLSRVYSWSISTPETLLRLSDLIANEIGVITTQTPVPPSPTPAGVGAAVVSRSSLHKKRTLQYSNMSWLTLQQSSKHCLKYLESTLASLEDIEPICGKFILVPSNCLKLIGNTTLSPPSSSSSLLTHTQSKIIPLSDVPREKIVTGLSVRIVSFDHLSRIYERVAWWDRPNQITLQSMAGKAAHILSTISLQETNRVGISIKDEATRTPSQRKNHEVIELIPIEGLLIEQITSCPPPPSASAPALVVASSRLRSLPSAENIEVTMLPRNEEMPEEEVNQERHRPLNDGETSPVIRIEKSSSYESAADASLLQVIPPLKISINDQQRRKSLLPVVETMTSSSSQGQGQQYLLPICQNDSTFFYDYYDSSATRPLYRPTTAGELNSGSLSSHLLELLPSTPQSPMLTNRTPRPTYLDFLDPSPSSYSDPPFREANTSSPAHAILLNEEPHLRPPDDIRLPPRGKGRAEGGARVIECQQQFSTSVDHQIFPMTVQVEKKKRNPQNKLRGCSGRGGEAHDLKKYPNNILSSKNSKKEKSFLGVCGSRKSFEMPSSSSPKPPKRSVS
jgi:hypothetical protein